MSSFLWKTDARGWLATDRNCTYRHGTWYINNSPFYFIFENKVLRCRYWNNVYLYMYIRCCIIYSVTVCIMYRYTVCGYVRRCIFRICCKTGERKLWTCILSRCCTRHRRESVGHSSVLNQTKTKETRAKVHLYNKKKTHPPPVSLFFCFFFFFFFLTMSLFFSFPKGRQSRFQMAPRCRPPFPLRLLPPLRSSSSRHLKKEEIFVLFLPKFRLAPLLPTHALSIYLQHSLL